MKAPNPPHWPQTHVFMHCIVFGCIWDRFVTAWNSVQHSVNWYVDSSFDALHSVWVHLGSFPNCMKLGAKQCELVQLMQKFVLKVTSGFFATNAPNPPHWTLNSCFGALHSVWVHLESFRNCMKLDPKHDELVQLMQKFVLQSHVRIFRNECTQSTPLDPKLMFWCVA